MDPTAEFRESDERLGHDELREHPHLGHFEACNIRIALRLKMYSNRLP